MLNKVLVLGIFFSLLVSCQNVSSPNPVAKEETLISDNEVNLFDDSDIDNARTISGKSPRTAEPIDLGEIADGATLPDLPNVETDSDDSELLNQAVLEKVFGIVYYIQYDTSLPEPYSVYKHDQASNIKTLVYEGQREIQSVAGDLSGNIIFLSMRRYTGGEFQIYRLNLLNGDVQQMTFNFTDNINISISRNAKVTVSQLEFNGSTTVVVSKFENATANSHYEYTNFTNYRDPSISADGRYLTAVRDLNNGKDRIYRIDLANNTRKTVATSGQLLENPSISDDGDRVLWLQHTNSDKRARVKTLSTGTTQNVYINPNTIEHPFITADGDFMTFGRKRKGGINVYTKDLELGITRRLSNAANPRNHLAMTWAQASKLVTSNNDSGLGSLREVIANAKSGDVIAFDTLGVFATPQEIILESQIDIDKDLIIGGTGAENLKLLVDSSTNTRIFHVHPAVNVVIDGMTITGGEAQDSGNEGGSSKLGGGIYNEGILTLLDSTVIDNKATKGGGIYNGNLGTLTILQSQILDNFNTKYGGAIYNKSSITIIDSAIRNNHAIRDGGGIYNDTGSNLRIRQSQIESNRSGNSGGGIANKGTLNILENSTLTSNIADVDTIDGEHA